MKVATRVSKVDRSKCVGCRACEVHCPTQAIRVGKGMGISFGGTEKGFVSPCQNACPAGVNVPSYLALAGAGRLQEAYQLIRRDNPFPSVCGRICTHPCETQCSRGHHDESVAIMDIKRYVSDYAFENGLASREAIWPKNGKSVGVIGAGPSGLSCAYYLALTGYTVEVYESQPVAGGVLVFGVPQFRLPKEILQRDISQIEQVGVSIHLNTEVGKDVTFDGLRRKHDAIYVATGTQLPSKVGIPGEELAGVYHGLDFLRDVNLKKEPAIGKKIVVIGGGSTAIDVARVAIRLGCKDVTILYRRLIQDMPAEQREVTQAMEEGVKLVTLAAPVEFVGRGKVEQIKCVRMALGEKDASGRRSPQMIKGSDFTIEADMVIPAVSQYSDLPFIRKDEVEVSEWGNFLVDETMMTSSAGIFSGGDVVRGSDVAITAIADGKKAAQSIHNYLGSQGAINKGAEIVLPERPEELVWDHRNRSQMKTLSPTQRKNDFAEVELGLSDAQVVAESGRCFRCVGTAKVDEAKCVDCGYCEEYCTHDAVKMVFRAEPRIFATEVKEEQRPQILEICRKAHIYPLEFFCGCTGTSAEQTVAAILNGAHTLEDITLATGAGSGCGAIYCLGKIMRLLHAAGIPVVERPDGRWHDIPLSLWDIPQEISAKHPVLDIERLKKLNWKEEVVETVEKAWGLK